MRFISFSFLLFVSISESRNAQQQRAPGTGSAAGNKKAAPGILPARLWVLRRALRNGTEKQRRAQEDCAVLLRNKKPLPQKCGSSPFSAA
jgi:hypothetical protein